MAVLVYSISVLCLFENFLVGMDECQNRGDNASKKIIYMISPPRSLSTVFTRMIQARGDFKIFHEPSQYAYDLIYYPEFAEASFKIDGFTSFAEVKENIFETSKERPVFVKEISFAVEEFLINDSEFIQNENVHFVFLMRDPHHTAISFYKKVQTTPFGMNHLLGYESLYRILSKVLKEAKHKPLILLTEDLYNAPEKTIQLFCQHTEIPYLPEALVWSNGETPLDIEKEWHELKFPQNIQHWHGDALNSNGIAKPSSYAVDDSGKPTFDEIQDQEHREYFMEAYFYNLPFYNKIIEILQNACI